MHKFIAPKLQVCSHSHMTHLPIWVIFKIGIEWTWKSDQASLARLMQMRDVGIGFGCPSGLTQPDPNKWENGEAVYGSFKTTHKLSLLKIKYKKLFLIIFLSLSENSLGENSLPKEPERDILASLSMKTTKKRNMFSSISRKQKSKNIILLKKNEKVLSWSCS